MERYLNMQSWKHLTKRMELRLFSFYIYHKNLAYNERSGKDENAQTYETKN